MCWKVILKEKYSEGIKDTLYIHANTVEQAIEGARKVMWKRYRNRQRYPIHSVVEFHKIDY